TLDSNIDGRGAVHVAARNNASDVLAWLGTEPGFNVNQPDARGDCALAEVSGNPTQALATLKELLAMPGIDVNHKDANGDSALLLYAKMGNVGPAPALVDQLLQTPGIDAVASDSKRQAFPVYYARYFDKDCTDLSSFIENLYAKDPFDLNAE